MSVAGVVVGGADGSPEGRRRTARAIVALSSAGVDRVEPAGPEGLSRSTLTRLTSSATIVVLDPERAVDEADLPMALEAVLRRLDTSGERDVVVATGPVTDTLKFVTGDVVTGTADRDEHRVVLTPVAVRASAVRDLLPHFPHGPRGTCEDLLRAVDAVGGSVLGA